MKKGYTTSYVLDILERHGIVWFSFIAVALVFLYGLLVSFSVTNVIVRDNAQQAVADLEGHLGTLEFDYLSVRDAVSEERAAELGLIPVLEKTYVARVPQTRVAALSE